MTGDSSMASRIAGAITEWAEGQPRWTPVPPDDEIAGRLDFTASRATFLAAKKRLAGQGVLVMAARAFYVAGAAS